MHRRFSAMAQKHKRHTATAKIQALVRGRQTRSTATGKAVRRILHKLTQITHTPSVHTYNPEDPAWLHTWSKEMHDLKNEIETLLDAITIVERENQEMRGMLRRAGTPY